MKKRTGRFYVLLPVVFTIGLYVVFYERIACKPNHAGFWLILVLGMSIGVALTRFMQWPRIEKTDNE
jgi:C4-dicarboxylate transporter